LPSGGRPRKRGTPNHGSRTMETRIEAVLFDWGGVLIDDPAPGLMNYCAKALGVPVAHYAQARASHPAGWGDGDPVAREGSDVAWAGESRCVGGGAGGPSGACDVWPRRADREHPDDEPRLRRDAQRRRLGAGGEPGRRDRPRVATAPSEITTGYRRTGFMSLAVGPASVYDVIVTGLERIMVEGVSQRGGQGDRNRCNSPMVSPATCEEGSRSAAQRYQ